MPEPGVCRRSETAWNVAVEVNHIVIPAEDTRATAGLLAHVLGLEVEADSGEFVRIRTIDGLTIDFSEPKSCWAFQCAFLVSDAEFDAATTPNMDVKVVGQADAARLEKDNPVRFTATLASFDPDPAFMLHWEKGKVNEEDIPKEKGKKPVRRKPS